MNRSPLQHSSKTIRKRRFFIAVLSAALFLAGTSVAIVGQTPQLSLADIIVALRSKKATLPEKNKILTDAVQTRGTTFSLTPEIEKELEGTGAEKNLIDSIRQRSQIAKTAAAVPPPVEPKPKVEISPSNASLDFSFYEKRADASVAKGDTDAAMMDYTKAVELNGSGVSALMGRAAIYFGKNAYTLAIADYTKVIELMPQDAAAYARRSEAHEKKGNADLALADYSKVIELSPKNPLAYAQRGEAYEKNGKADLALADYKKLLDLDPANDQAKAAVARLEPEKPKPVPQVTPAPPVAEPVLPEFIMLGQLSESMAISSAKPSYPMTALHANIGGKVVVEVEIDLIGNVSSAKTISGNPYFKQTCEDAARKWRFKPAMVGYRAVKSKGYITFSFVPTR